LRHGFVEIPEADVHYLEAGSGRPLLLLHGLAASWRWWTPILDYLTPHHRVLAIDLPGFGLTRARRRFSLKSAGQFVCQVMEALALERADLIGHSLGGRISMDVAAHCPERVRRLVLVSAVGLSWRKPYPMVGLDLLLEGWRNAPKFPDLVREDARRVNFLELCLATYEVLSDDFQAELHRIAAPTLVLWGDRDLLTPPRHGEILTSAIPSAELAYIRGAGHTPMWDAPEEFSRRVLEFLAGSTQPALTSFAA
jgi:pimeloyl-ACP methyl ester carboxylesterase